MKKYIFLFLLICSRLPANAQVNSALNNFMQYCQGNFRFNGVVLIADSNRILYAHAFEKINKGNKTGVELNTKFRLGSISKQFTSFIILQLVKKGKLSLNNYLAEYIPAFNEENKRQITIRNLLTHTSGLADYTSLRGFNDQIYYPADSIVKMISLAPLSFPPSSGYAYCNSNFYLLGLIIEKVTGKVFADVLQEMILQKADMLHSGEDEGGKIKNLAAAYLYRNDSNVTAPYIEMKNTKGGGGMYSTAEDLLNWSLFFQYTLAHDSLLKQQLKPFVLTDGTQTIYSSGWCLMPDVIYHAGHITGFANLIAIDTTRHHTIILLTNDDYQQLYITMESLRNILLNDQTATSWLDNKPANNLADYRGTYFIGNFKVHIKDSLSFLEAEAFGHKETLRWFSSDEFFFTETEGTVKFERDNSGTVIGLKRFQDYSWVRLTKE
jgi:CubicO group peptidase (beta-lactamase class C family)